MFPGYEQQHALWNDCWNEWYDTYCLEAIAELEAARIRRWSKYFSCLPVVAGIAVILCLYFRLDFLYTMSSAGLTIVFPVIQLTLRLADKQDNWNCKVCRFNRMRHDFENLRREMVESLYGSYLDLLKEFNILVARMNEISTAPGFVKESLKQKAKGIVNRRIGVEP